MSRMTATITFTGPLTSGTMTKVLKQLGCFMMNDETTLLLIPNSMRWSTNVLRYLEEHAFKPIYSNVIVEPTCSSM